MEMPIRTVPLGSILRFKAREEPNFKDSPYYLVIGRWSSIYSTRSLLNLESFNIVKTKDLALAGFVQHELIDKKAGIKVSDEPIENNPIHISDNKLVKGTVLRRYTYDTYERSREISRPLRECYIIGEERGRGKHLINVETYGRISMGDWEYRSWVFKKHSAELTIQAK